MKISLVVRFSGGDAEQHRLPAYNATESLDGIARSSLILTNYLVERRVRHKNFSYTGYSVDLVALQPGSFEALFDINILNHCLEYLPEIGIGIASNFLTDVFRAIFRRSIGGSAPQKIEELEASEKLSAGDMGALVDAVEPAIRRAHTVISQGAESIDIIAPDADIVNFDPASKAFVNKSIFDNEPMTKLFSIGSYNANSRYGRAFDFSLGKTIPFTVLTTADADTMRVILDSIRSYALKKEGVNLDSAVALRYTRILAIDGRVKKMTIFKARKEIADL